MEPLEIRIALMRAGVRQADIARVAHVTTPHIARVINGQSSSDRVQRMIAKAIGQPVEAVFPERYGRGKDGARELEKRLAG